MNNAVITRTVRLAAAPNDLKAGMCLHAKKGHQVGMGDPVFTVCSSSAPSLQRAVKYATGVQPLTVEGMVIERVRTG